MKLSTKGKYGLRALIDLAQYSEDSPVSITSIARRQDISERYLEQLMSKLKWWICLSKGSKRYFCRRCASCTGRKS